MKPRDVFGIVMRTVGLISLLYGLMGGMLFFSFVSFAMIVRALVWLVVSIWLVRGAPQLVRFAYGDDVRP